MKYILYTKKIYVVMLTICMWLVAGRVSASVVTIQPSQGVVNIGQQFYVDVLLDPQGISVNAVDGTLLFPSDTLKYIGAYDGKSMITTWIQKPYRNDSTISFSGIISNGFTGVIDPFNATTKRPGPIVRLVFEGVHAGTVLFNTGVMTIAHNDGTGTLEESLPAHATMSISTTDFPSTLVTKGDSVPSLEASITRDPNLFNNKYALIFSAFDKGTGIQKVMVQEGSHPWKEISSPYLLEDQTRHSIITLQAINYSGASVVTTIDALPYTFSERILFSIVVGILVMFLFLIVKKIYVYKKSISSL